MLSNIRYGCFLKWWVSPHFTPQVLIIFARENPWVCWVPPWPQLAFPGAASKLLPPKPPAGAACKSVVSCITWQVELSFELRKLWLFWLKKEKHLEQTRGGCFQKYPKIGYRPPQSSHFFNRVFHYKPSIFGACPYCWKQTMWIAVITIQLFILFFILSTFWNNCFDVWYFDVG